MGSTSALNLEESQIRAYKQQRVVGADAEDLLHIIASSRGRRRKGLDAGVTK